MVKKKRKRKKSRKFNFSFLIFLLTIIVARLGVFLIPEVDMKLFGFVVHHFWFGIILLLVGLFLFRNVYVLSIGLGLFVDQLVFMLLGAGMDKQYWNPLSVIGVFVLVSAVYFLKKKVIKDGF